MMPPVEDLRALQDDCVRLDAERSAAYAARDAAVLAARAVKSQRAVAAELGVTYGAVQDIERRAKRLSTARTCSAEDG
jgi:hypothetical protein